MFGVSVCLVERLIWQPKTDGKTFHTGRTVARIEDLGYTYPDILSGDHGRNENVIVRINRLYGNPATAGQSKAIVTSRRSWFVEIRVAREDLLLPCSIDVYLGHYLAGQTLLLDMPKTGYAHDEISLLRAVDHIGISDNQPEDIERKIMKYLHIRVTKVCSNRLYIVLKPWIWMGDFACCGECNAIHPFLLPFPPFLFLFFKTRRFWMLTIPLAGRAILYLILAAYGVYT